MSVANETVPKKRGRPRTRPLTPVERDLAAIKAQIQDNTGIVLNQINGRPKGIAIDDLIAYREQGLSYDDIGKLVGCNKVNVYQRLREYSDDIDYLPTFRRNEQTLIDILKARILTSYSVAEIKQASPKDRAIILGILYDKSKQHFQSTTTNVFNVVIQQAHSVKSAQVIDNLQEINPKTDNVCYVKSIDGPVITGPQVPQGGDGEAGQNPGG